MIDAKLFAQALRAAADVLDPLAVRAPNEAWRQQSVDDLCLGGRAYNAVKRLMFERGTPYPWTVGMVADVRDSDFLMMPGTGRGTVNQIRRAIARQAHGSQS